MSALLIAAIVLACVFAGALFGMFLRGVLPVHHLSEESKDVVRLATGLVATMAALVLGLLVASAKGSYDTQRNGLDEITANVTLLDIVLQQYGPPAAEARGPRVVAGAIARLWPADAARATWALPRRSWPPVLHAQPGAGARQRQQRAPGRGVQIGPTGAYPPAAGRAARGSTSPACSW
jgi:hypothetical protein